MWYDVTVRAYVRAVTLLLASQTKRDGVRKMKKAIPVIIAIVLILAIGVVGFGGKIFEKYSYGTITY